MNLTTHQLAEILIGIARSQQAIIEGIESMKAGFKGTYLSPALDSVAKIRSTGRPLALQDFPARVLLQCQGRAGPNIEQMVRDLEIMLSAQPASPSAVSPAANRAVAGTAAPAPAAAAPAPASVPVAKSENDLDMT